MLFYEERITSASDGEVKLSGMKETYYYAKAILPFNEQPPSVTGRGMLMFL